MRLGVSLFTVGQRRLRSQVETGSESDYLLGQLDSILKISDSEAGVKEDKSGDRL